jgi:hypothetical protein
VEATEEEVNSADQTKVALEERVGMGFAELTASSALSASTETMGKMTLRKSENGSAAAAAALAAAVDGFDLDAANGFAADERSGVEVGC